MRYVLTLVLVLLLVASADARGRRQRGQQYWTPAYSSPAYSSYEPAQARPVMMASDPTGDALAHVNARRARLGLRPFIEDPGLTVAAENASRYRAAHRIAGHANNDFAFLPQGCRAAAAGCAAWPPWAVNALGWGSCCSDENWTYAGAGYAYGSDGLKYMHLFVR